jgi:hypothetical protein
MDRIVSAFFWLFAALFGVLFLLLFATKLTAGQWQGYLGMAMFAVGCASCVVAARRPERVPEHQDA